MDFLTLGKHLSQALEWLEDGSLATLDGRDRQIEEWAQISYSPSQNCKNRGKAARKGRENEDFRFRLQTWPTEVLALSLPRGPSDKLRQFVSSLFLAPTPGLHQAFEK